MIVTDGELTGLSAISGGGGLPDIPVRVSGVGDAQEAMQGLKKKGVVTPGGELTTFGFLPVKAVEEYRNAERHLVFNQLRASVNPDGALTVLRPVSGGWDLSRKAPVELVLVLLDAYPFLRGGGPDSEPGPWQKLSAQDWALGREGGPELVVRTLEGWSKVLSVVAFDERRGMGFEFDLRGGAGRVTPLWRVRVHVAKLVGLENPVLGVGRGT